MESLLMPILMGLVFVGSTTSQGTTDDLRSIFIGRCSDYKATIVNPLLERAEADCRDLWDEFSKAFMNKPACSDTQDDYLPFLEKASQDFLPDKMMFWSGSAKLVHEYVRRERYITLEDSFIGYLVDKLTWCGTTEEPGIDYDSCPVWGSCPDDGGMLGYWKAASRMFAQKAEGRITLMLSGSDPDRPAYRKDSIFGSVEIHSLNVSKVEKVQVFLTHEIGKPRTETCETGSLVTLREDVLAKGFEFTCEDDPESVMYFQCADETDSQECKTFSAEAAGDLCSV